MKTRIMSGTGLVVLVVGLAAAMAGASSVAPDGRYKKQGDRCLWDDKDKGPNQCAPLTAGRFKKDGEACVWMPRDEGSDQCRPSKGRFKKEGSGCVWTRTDSGPDQCDAHKSM